MRCVEFGDCFVEDDGFGATVCIRTPNNPNTVLAGSYESVSRAKAVLQEVIYAFVNGEPMFYMPAE